MIDLEVSQFVRIGGRDLCGQASVQREGRDGCTFGGSPIFVDDSPFDSAWTFIRRNNSRRPNSAPLSLDFLPASPREGPWLSIRE